MFRFHEQQQVVDRLKAGHNGNNNNNNNNTPASASSSPASSLVVVDGSGRQQQVATPSTVTLDPPRRQFSAGSGGGGAAAAGVGTVGAAGGGGGALTSSRSMTMRARGASAGPSAAAQVVVSMPSSSAENDRRFLSGQPPSTAPAHANRDSSSSSPQQQHHQQQQRNQLRQRLVSTAALQKGDALMQHYVELPASNHDSLLKLFTNTDVPEEAERLQQIVVPGELFSAAELRAEQAEQRFTDTFASLQGLERELAQMRQRLHDTEQQLHHAKDQASFYKNENTKLLEQERKNKERMRELSDVIDGLRTAKGEVEQALVNAEKYVEQLQQKNVVVMARSAKLSSDLDILGQSLMGLQASQNGGAVSANETFALPASVRMVLHRRATEGAGEEENEQATASAAPAAASPETEQEEKNTNNNENDQQENEQQQQHEETSPSATTKQSNTNNNNNNPFDPSLSTEEKLARKTRELAKLRLRFFVQEVSGARKLAAMRRVAEDTQSELDSYKRRFVRRVHGFASTHADQLRADLVFNQKQANAASSENNNNENNDDILQQQQQQQLQQSRKSSRRKSKRSKSGEPEDDEALRLAASRLLHRSSVLRVMAQASGSIGGGGGFAFDDEDEDDIHGARDRAYRDFADAAVAVAPVSWQSGGGAENQQEQNQQQEHNQQQRQEELYPHSPTAGVTTAGPCRNRNCKLLKHMMRDMLAVFESQQMRLNDFDARHRLARHGPYAGAARTRSPPPTSSSFRGTPTSLVQLAKLQHASSSSTSSAAVAPPPQYDHQQRRGTTAPTASSSPEGAGGAIQHSQSREELTAAEFAQAAAATTQAELDIRHEVATAQNAEDASAILQQQCNPKSTLGQLVKHLQEANRFVLQLGADSMPEAHYAGRTLHHNRTLFAASTALVDGAASFLSGAETAVSALTALETVLFSSKSLPEARIRWAGVRERASWVDSLGVHVDTGAVALRDSVIELRCYSQKSGGGAFGGGGGAGGGGGGGGMFSSAAAAEQLETNFFGNGDAAAAFLMSDEDKKIAAKAELRRQRRLAGPLGEEAEERRRRRRERRKRRKRKAKLKKLRKQGVISGEEDLDDSEFDEDDASTSDSDFLSSSDGDDESVASSDGFTESDSNNSSDDGGRSNALDFRSFKLAHNIFHVIREFELEIQRQKQHGLPAQRGEFRSYVGGGHAGDALVDATAQFRKATSQYTNSPDGIYRLMHDAASKLRFIVPIVVQAMQKYRQWDLVLTESAENTVAAAAAAAAGGGGASPLSSTFAPGAGGGAASSSPAAASLLLLSSSSDPNSSSPQLLNLKQQQMKRKEQIALDVKIQQAEAYRAAILSRAHPRWRILLDRMMTFTQKRLKPLGKAIGAGSWRSDKHNTLREQRKRLMERRQDKARNDIADGDDSEQDLDETQGAAARLGIASKNQNNQNNNNNSASNKNLQGQNRRAKTAGAAGSMKNIPDVVARLYPKFNSSGFRRLGRNGAGDGGGAVGGGGAAQHSGANYLSGDNVIDNDESTTNALHHAGSMRFRSRRPRPLHLDRGPKAAMERWLARRRNVWGPTQHQQQRQQQQEGKENGDEEEYETESASSSSSSSSETSSQQRQRQHQHSNLQRRASTLNPDLRAQAAQQQREALAEEEQRRQQERAERRAERQRRADELHRMHRGRISVVEKHSAPHLFGSMSPKAGDLGTEYNSVGEQIRRLLDGDQINKVSKILRTQLRDEQNRCDRLRAEVLELRKTVEYMNQMKGVSGGGGGAGGGGQHSNQQHDENFANDAIGGHAQSPTGANDILIGRLRQQLLAEQEETNKTQIALTGAREEIETLRYQLEVAHRALHQQRVSLGLERPGRVGSFQLHNNNNSNDGRFSYYGAAAAAAGGGGAGHSFGSISNAVNVISKRISRSPQRNSAAPTTTTTTSSSSMAINQNPSIPFVDVNAEQERQILSTTATRPTPIASAFGSHHFGSTSAVVRTTSSSIGAAGAGGGAGTSTSSTTITPHPPPAASAASSSSANRVFRSHSAVAPPGTAPATSQSPNQHRQENGNRARAVFPLTARRLGSDGSATPHHRPHTQAGALQQHQQQQQRWQRDLENWRDRRRRNY